MKKHFVFSAIFALTATGLTMAEQSILLSKQAHKRAVMPENFVANSTNSGNVGISLQSNKGTSKISTSPGIVIGNGHYDYQANGAIGKRFVIDDCGNFHTVAISASIYTTDPTTNTTRGSFYSFSNDGINWGLDDGTGTVVPTWTRIENARSGFPSLAVYPDDSQNVPCSPVIASHIQDPSLNGDLRSMLSVDLFAGQGLWEHKMAELIPNLPTGTDQPIWPVTTVGKDDKTHLMASLSPDDQATDPLSLYYSYLNNPFDQNLTPYLAMDNLQGVYVATDAGAKTFISDGADHLILLFFTASGSSFQDTLAHSNALHKFESFDNGATWAFSALTDDTPLNFVSSNDPEDMEWRAWTHFDASFDAQGNPHYIYTEYKSTSSGSYFPNAYRLVYEGPSGIKRKIFAYDDSYLGEEIAGGLFEDGSAWSDPNTAPSPADFAGAFQQAVSTPMLGFDQNGDLHAVFVGYPAGNVDWNNAPNGDSLNAMTFGDVFHTMSTDGGISWGFGGQSVGNPEIENVTSTPFDDERYALIPERNIANGFVDIVFQTDEVAGSYSYNDNNPLAPHPANGTNINYFKHANGTGSIYSLLVTDVEDKVNPAVAKGFELKQNFPNPFNPTTTIDYELAVSNSEIGKLAIYNIRGEKVKEFEIKGSKGSVVWDGTDSFGKEVASGTYFYQLKAANFSETKKMTLLK